MAHEGWRFILITFVLAIFVQFFSGFKFAFPIYLFLIFLLQFFRDPWRDVPKEKNVVLSPADGRVVILEHIMDPFLERQSLKISIFMNVFNVHSQRFPVNGEVLDIKYFPGKFFNATLDKASEQNERNALIIRTDDGSFISCVQIAGLIARRILCYVKIGDRLERGHRYGFIRFGSRVDVYLPINSVPLVMLGQKVYASSTILAQLPN